MTNSLLEQFLGQRVICVMDDGSAIGLLKKIEEPFIQVLTDSGRVMVISIACIKKLKEDVR